MNTKHWLIGGGIAAAAALGVYATSAKAADLGGSGCCSDLEERVAELEATTARSGNRKVKLSISGFVSHQVMHWDDGGMTDTYIGDGAMNSSRFRLAGVAKISPAMTAGFTYEFGINNNAIGSMNQGAGGDDLGGNVLLRDSTVWLKHATLGKIKIGHGSTATDNLILLDVSNAGVAASSDPALWNGGFLLRSTLAGNSLVPITWANMLNQGVSFDTARRNHVLYETPTLAGFTVQAAVAEDNFWDAALRFAGEFSGFRLAAAVGYSVDTEAPVFHPLAPLAFAGLPATEIKSLMGAVSVMHVQSGLFVTASGAQRETGFSISGGASSISAKDSQMWHVIAGIQRNWTGLGATTLYGEYHEAKDMVGFSTVNLAGIDISSKANVMGFGVVQAVDAAALDVWASYKQYSGDIDLTSNIGSGSLGVSDFSTVMAGVKLSF